MASSMSLGISIIIHIIIVAGPASGSLSGTEHVATTIESDWYTTATIESR